MRKGTSILLSVLFVFAASSPSLEITLDGESVNASPIKKKDHCYRDKPTPLIFSFLIYFPIDDKRYRPVDANLARLIGKGHPSVEAPAGINIETKSVLCVPTSLKVIKGTKVMGVTGARITYRGHVKIDDRFSGGSATAVLQFRSVDMISALLPQSSAQRKPTQVRVSLSIYESKAAHEEMIRKVEEEHKAKIEEEERKKEALKKTEAAEQARKRKRTLIWGGSIIGVIVLLVGIYKLVFAIYRPWLTPDVSVRVNPGKHVQKPGVLAFAKSEDKERTGVVHETLWAVDRKHRRQRIKVETFAAGERLLDVLVSAGASVKKGKYIAKAAGGNILITIT